MNLTPPSLFIKRWCKDAKSTSHAQNNGSSNQQDDLIQMSRYDSLNTNTNLMNYCASKVEISFYTAKNEIARLTAMFKKACEMKSNHNSNYCTSSYHNNPNIIKDLVIVRTKGVGNSGITRKPMDGEGLVGTVKRARKWAICNGVGNDTRNYTEHA